MSVSRLGLSKRAMAAVAATFALLPTAGGAVHAATTTAQDTGALCADAGSDNPFTDVVQGSHHDNIICLAAAGIAGGTTASTFDPSSPVRRDQMAGFLARAIDLANLLGVADDDLNELPPAGTDQFGDVAAASVHRSAIARLFEAGIVTGVDARTFDPTGAVTRGQMASLVNRAEAFLTGAAFPTTTDHFTDDDGSWHEDNINAIASAGIAQIGTARTYRPGDPVTRAQMASFAIRWLAVLESAGLIAPLSAGTGADLEAVSVADADRSGTLTKGDGITLKFADAVVVSSSVTLTDGSGTSVTLTDDSPTPPGATPASFTLSDDGTTLVVVPTGPVVFNGGSGLQGSIVVTAATGIDDAASGAPWRPSVEPVAEVRFELERQPIRVIPVPAPAPAITSVSPSTGPEAGGIVVTITGTGLTDATSVTFGGVPAGFTVVSSTQIEAATPAGTGSVDVVVTMPDGSASLPGGYTYFGVTVIMSLSPNTGTAMGGTTVTITGSGFTGATGVTFGGADALFTVDSDTQITATAPATTNVGASGGFKYVDVGVSTPGGSPLMSSYKYFWLG